MSVLITEIEPSGWVNAKINSKHNAALREIEEVFEGYVEARWHAHERYGRRLLVRGKTRSGRRLKVILYPTDEARGTFRLGTALVDTNQGGR